MPSFPPRQLWVNAFPALAGLAVALGSLGSGGSLWQSGAAALATGMTGYLASALAGSEAKAKVQLLEQSLEHFKSRQELGLQHLQNELADLRAALANWAPIRQEEKAGDGTKGSRIRSQQAWLSQLRAEEQNLKASVEDLQAKKQKLVQLLKEYVAKIDQLRRKRDLLAQEITRLHQTRQATGSGNFAAHPSGFGKGSLGFSSISTTKAAATSASASTYDEVFAAMEKKVNELEDMAKAMTELGSLEGRR